MGSQVNVYTYGVDDAVEVLLHEALVLGHGARIPYHHRQLDERQQSSRSALLEQLLNASYLGVRAALVEERRKGALLDELIHRHQA